MSSGEVKTKTRGRPKRPASQITPQYIQPPPANRINATPADETSPPPPATPAEETSPPPPATTATIADSAATAAAATNTAAPTTATTTSSSSPPPPPGMALVIGHMPVTPPPLAPLSKRVAAPHLVAPVPVHPLRPRQMPEPIVEEPEPVATGLPSHWGLAHTYDEANKKKQKRLEQNRAAASASRTRKKLYLEKLEAENAELKKEVAELKAQLAMALQHPPAPAALFTDIPSHPDTDDR